MDVVWSNSFAFTKTSLHVTYMQKLDSPASNRGFQNATADDRADRPLISRLAIDVQNKQDVGDTIDWLQSLKHFSSI